MKESKHSLEKLWCKQGLVWVFLKPGRRLWNFQHTRQWQNQRRRKPIVRNGVQGYSKVPDEVEVWDDGELCQYIYSEVTSSHTTCRVPGYVYHLSFCCHRNIALNFHGKNLTSLPSAQQWFMNQCFVPAMPCTASVEVHTDSEWGNSAWPLPLCLRKYTQFCFKLLIGRRESC